MNWSPPQARAQSESNYAAESPRPSIVVGLPNLRSSSGGQVLMSPNVNFVGSDGAPNAYPQPVFRPAPTAERVAAQITSDGLPPPPAPGLAIPSETLPPPGSMLPPDADFSPAPTPVFNDMVLTQPPPRGLRNFLIARNIEAGVGRGRLAHAPFEIDTSAPLPSVRFRMNSFGTVPFPDRAEYLWARAGGRGPGSPETSIDYQEFRTQLELGSKKFSTATEFPIRWTNPHVNRNHAGFGDMTLATKLVIVDGDKWQLTQLMRTYFPTGSASMGLGTGHISMEPGGLMRYKWSEVTFIHGEMKYFFPIGGDPNQQGQILKYGLGASHVLVDRDNTAWLSTLEFTGAYVGNGLQTNPNGTVGNAEGQHIFNLFPGLRYVRDCGGDLGIFEVGVCGGLPVSTPRFYADLFRLDLRWSF